MKIKMSIALLALSAAFNVMAQDAAADVADPTELCMAWLTADHRLAIIADKVALEGAGTAPRRPLNRLATKEERKAITLWQDLRKQCFDAGEPYRAIVLDPMSIALARSAFTFQQWALADLANGRATYAEYSQRRFDLAEGLDSRL